MNPPKSPPNNNPYLGYQLSNGQHVVNEACRCKHPRTQHAEPSGHGMCDAKDCKCRKFTWMAFVAV